MSGQDKLFNDALKKGRQQDSFYRLENSGGKYVEEGPLKEYAKAHSYYIGTITTETKMRFGNPVNSVKTMEFLPENELIDYIVANLRNSSLISGIPQSFKFNGKPACGWITKEHISGIDAYRNNVSPFFTRFDNIKWTGTIKDGVIDGDGVGVIDGDNKLFIFTGKFQNGFPVGQFTVCQYTKTVLTKKNYCFDREKVSDIRKASLTAFTGNTATYAYDGYTAIISPDGSGVLDPRFIARRDSIKRAEEMALEKKARESDPQYNWEKSHTIYFSSTYRKGYHSFSFSEHHSDKDRFKMKQALQLESDAFLGFGTPYGDYYAPAGQFYAEELDDYLASGDKDNYSSTTWFVLNLLKQLPELKKSRILADRLSHSCLKHWWLKDYFDLYGNYGSLTEEEINKWEIDYILNNRAEDVVASYNKYFPKGKRKGYSKEDFKKDYVSLFIDEATRVIASDELPRLSCSFDGASILSGDARVDFRRKYLEQLKTENYPDADFALDCLHFMDAYYLSASADTTTYVLYQRDTEGAYLLDAEEYVKSLQQGLKAAAPIKERLITIKDICQKKEDKIRHWYTRIDDINLDARIHRQGLREKHNEEFKVFKAEMCEKCRIDGSKTTTPKGWDSGNPDLIFGRPAQSDEAGKVVLVNGEEIKWKYVKYDSGTIIEARGAYYGDYKTVDEMMSAIIRMCNDKWR